MEQTEAYENILELKRQMGKLLLENTKLKSTNEKLESDIIEIKYSLYKCISKILNDKRH